MKLHEIPNNEPAKRAIEIALVGNHSIKFIGNSEAEFLGERSKELGLKKVLVVKPCPCGNKNDREKTCHCTTSEINRYYKTRKMREHYDLTIEIPRTPTLDTIHQESEKKMLERVKQARKYKIFKELEELEIKAEQLLDTASKQLHLSFGELLTLKNIASSIARLDSWSKIIKTSHIAEALQYRPKI